MRRLALVLAVLAIGALTAPGARSDAPAPTKTYFYLPAADGKTQLRACAIALPGALASRAHDHPVIVEWTSYAIDADYGGGFPSGCPPQFGTLADRAARDGYVYVAVNTRGTGASDGDFQDVWSLADGRDGLAAVDWLGRQPWSTGAVGVVGCSNSGAFANGVGAADVERRRAGGTSHLRAIVTDCAPLDPYRDAIYPGGLASYSLLFTSTRPVASQDTPQGISAQAQRGDTSFLARPARSSLLQAQLITDRTDTAVWRDRDLTSYTPFAVPTYYLGSWSDYMLRGTTEYAARRGRSDRILITPGEHAAAYLNITGRYGLVDRALAWFDTHLRGRPFRFADEPPVLWWELDGGRSPIPTGSSPAVDLDPARFHGTGTWPPAQVRYAAWFLRAGATGTSWSVNDGTLSTRGPSGPEPGDAYAYPGGSGATLVDPHQPGGDSVPSQVSDTGDAATYTSAPLRHDLHVAGPVTMSLWATTTAPDTDWVVRLADVAPDGTTTEVTEGWLRAALRANDAVRSRHDARGRVVRPYHPSLVAQDVSPLAPTSYLVELEPTATVFRAGHRVRVVVQSTAAPWFVQQNIPAVNTVLHDAAHPSQLLLPVLGGG